MATTAWTPCDHPLNTPYLTIDGHVLPARPLERTPTGRRFRFIDVPTQSASAGQLEDMLWADVVRRAHEIDSKPWLPIDNERQVREERAIFDTRNYPVAQFHLVHARPSVRPPQTYAWWRFRHATKPLTAVLLVTANESFSPSSYVMTGRHKINISVLWPTKSWGELRHSRDASTVQVRSTVNAESLLRPVLDLTGFHVDDERLAAQRLLQTVRAVQDMLDEVGYFPLWNDWTEVDERLELVETNVTDDLETGILAFLDGVQVVTEIAELYGQMIDKMRQLGVVMPPRNRNVFLAALIGHEEDAALIPLRTSGRQLNDAGQVLVTASQASHAVYLDLPSGTILTHCLNDVGSPEPNDIALDWATARITAELTGEEDELLHYAREWVRRKRIDLARDHIAGRRRVNRIARKN